MYIILVLMALGFLVGVLIRNNQKIVYGVDKAILFSIFMLLFFLGLSIGGDKLLIASLPSLGFNAFLITIGGVAGSVVAAWAVWKFLFNPNRSSP